VMAFLKIDTSYKLASMGESRTVGIWLTVV
jgi:hypothetical protein